MWSETLNAREDEVLRVMLALAAGKTRFLAAPCEVLAALSPKRGYDEEKLERVLRSLETDGYFELIATDRKGEKTYVVEMREKGTSYLRAARAGRRRLLYRLAVTALCGLASALAGLLIRLLLSRIG